MNQYMTESSLRSGTRFMQSVYAWMAGGLGLTALTAFGMAAQGTVLAYLLQHSWLMFALMFASIGVVIYLSARLDRISVMTARVLFLAYAALIGVTLSPIFYVYQLGSIGLCFGITAGMFAVMATYGYVTKADLSGFGSIMLMGVFGLIIAGVVNLFLRSDTMSMVISFIGVLLFAGLVAYDMQKIKQIAQNSLRGEFADERKIAVLCALTLYLDVVNLFMYLLRLLGKRRN